jgi:hypothetical protein
MFLGMSKFAELTDFRFKFVLKDRTSIGNEVSSREDANPFGPKDWHEAAKFYGLPGPVFRPLRNTLGTFVQVKMG